MPGTISANDKSDLVFYFNGVRIGQPIVGSIHGYFLVGGYTIKDVGYIPHELWFRDNGSMVRPKDLGLDETLMYTTDVQMVAAVNALTNINTIEKHYILGFLDPDCGGETTKAIEASGHAFNLARPY